MTWLHPCPSCARHVRAGTVDCPFCGQAVGETPPRPATRAVPRGRITRAAIVLGAALAMPATACGGGDSQTTTTHEESGSGGEQQGGDQGGDGTITPGDGQGGGGGGGDVRPMYGVPAEPDDDGGSAAEYGAPAPGE